MPCPTPAQDRSSTVTGPSDQGIVPHPIYQTAAVASAGGPGSASSTFLVTTWVALREVLPAPTAVNGCSFGILGLCLAVFSFQTNATVVFIDDTALAAAILACSASGVALLFGLLRIIYNRLTCRTKNNILCQCDSHIVSLMIHATSCAALLLAVASFSTFVVHVAWKTTPRVSTAFFAIFGSVSSILFLSILAHRISRSRSSPSQQLETDSVV